MMTEFDAYALAFWGAWAIGTIAALGMAARVVMDWRAWCDGQGQLARLIIRTVECAAIWAGLIIIAAIQGIADA